jgi:mannan endo-1,4-beta-mannosidase
MAMTAGRQVDLRLEYYQNAGESAVLLSWSSPSQLKAWVPMASLFPPPATIPAPPPAARPVPRPAYNTGTGFYVVGNKLYDANGNEFRMRGLNHLHWDAAGVGIPKTGANTERWVIDLGQSAATNIGLMQKTINNKMVPMAGNWDGTCDENASTLSSIVNKWVATAAQWKTVEKYVLINIANEWGPSSSTVWRDAYTSAIAQLRAVGINSTLVVDAGGCGQDNADLVQYAAAVFNSDPQKNVVFDQHIYGQWKSGSGQSWQTDLNGGLDALAATGLPFIVGEVGPGRNIGPSPTMITPGQIIQASEAHGFGWLAWAWDDPAGEWESTPRDDWFALSYTGDYRSSADLTTFGKDVVENSVYGLKAKQKPASIF